ncbi:MAG TPA: PrgI family protein [Candidatus Paceibacterota bacterium]|nr:PrgI family protein [Candidatus Paceibacterota bacterium]
MQFKVPQFIDVEDKLFGPFTFHQFAYLAGGAGLIYVLYKVLPFWISIFLILPVAALSLLLVFYKVNEKPFIFYLQAGVNYFISSKLYIWKQRLVKPVVDKDKEKEQEGMPMVSIIPMTSSDKIKDLAWSLDVQEKETEKQ